MKITIQIFVLVSVISISLTGQNIKVTPVSDDVIILHPENYRDINEIRKVGGHITAVRTDSGIVVFDSFISSEAAEIGKNLIHKYFSYRPIIYLVNTHHHADHVEGNSTFNNAFTFAHQNLQKHNNIQINLYLTSDTLLNIGGKTFEIIYFGSAHTNSDIIILDTNDKLLIMGDLLCFKKCYILVQESDVKNWISLLDRILQRKTEYQFVIPGHGGVVKDNNSLIEQRNYLVDLCNVVKNAKNNNLSFEEAKQAIQLDAYNDYLLFDKIELDLKVCWRQIAN
jgi:glyoxylase-like metal-dependent hydrolase (beta-lactamase superfamily II)